MSLLDIIKGAPGLAQAAVPGAVAARSGYLEGEQEKAARELATRRQSLMDQIKLAMDQSTIDTNTARRGYYESRSKPQTKREKADFDVNGQPVAGSFDPTTGKRYDEAGNEIPAGSKIAPHHAVSTSAPRTVATGPNRRLKQWNPATRRYEDAIDEQGRPMDAPPPTADSDTPEHLQAKRRDYVSRRARELMLPRFDQTPLHKPVPGYGLQLKDAMQKANEEYDAISGSSGSASPSPSDRTKPSSLTPHQQNIVAETVRRIRAGTATLDDAKQLFGDTPGVLQAITSAVGYPK